MLDRKLFAVVGGDLRHARLANLLSEDGYKVNTVCFDEGLGLGGGVNRCKSLQECLRGAFCVILPLPYTSDGVYINSPLSAEKILLSELFQSFSRGQLVVGGKLDDRAWKLAAQCGIKLVDYLEREEFAVQNAVPTAEGAIQIAFEELPFTLHGSECLVIGFGRVGKVLAKDLFGLGAHVWVALRRYSEAAWADAYGYRHVLVQDLEDVLGTFSLIYNTVPSLILDDKRLSLLKKDCLVIDLASKPGGVDFLAASALGVKTIWALSIPGKYSPFTAGEIILNTVYNIIAEEAISS